MIGRLRPVAWLTVSLAATLLAVIWLGMAYVPWSILR